MCPVFRNLNGYFEETTKSKYLTLVSTNERKEKKKNNYDEKYFRIKFRSDDELPLNKTIEIPTITIAFRAALHENKKNYSQVF